jgi:hypothetical protein
MTEEEWLACEDPKPMLEYLKGNVSDRRLRLFAVSCCHRIWHLILDKRSQEAVREAERFSDARTNAERTAVRRVRMAALEAEENSLPPLKAARASIARSGIDAAKRASHLSAVSVSQADDGIYVKERAAQVAFAREIFGNPFRPITINPSWCTSTVLALASGIYNETGFDRMPILADALQDAGCDDEDILRHCRKQKEHVRGCWVVDLLLDKR